MMFLKTPVIFWCNATPAQFLKDLQAIQSLMFRDFKPGPMLKRAPWLLATADETAADSISIHSLQFLSDSNYHLVSHSTQVYWLIQALQAETAM